jgi:hypothetical protein
VRRPSPALVVSITALVVAMSGVAVAANPFASDGTLIACYNPENFESGGSSIMVVKDASDCDNNDYGASFRLNAQGPQGVPGPQGPQGANGANGAQGAQGPAGQVVPAPAKLTAVEATKLTQQVGAAGSKLESQLEKLDKAKDQLGDAKSTAQLQKQLEALMKMIQQMFAVLLQGQQSQQNALGSISSSMAVGNAAQKLKDADKAADKAKDAQERVEKADTAKEQQKALDQMIQQILAFMKSMQEAQNEQMKAITRG